MSWTVEFDKPFDIPLDKTLSTEQQYYRRKIKESLGIKKAKANKRRKVLNCDEGNLVKTSTQSPFFEKLTAK